jgi:glycosyltransferase involved in cell wall biosynthesis
MTFVYGQMRYSLPAFELIVHAKELESLTSDTPNAASELRMGNAVPFITVAIPTYRRLPMLRRAIESVFAQTFTDWEIVISDDEAPPGETWKFLEALAGSDARIRPIRNSSPHGASFNHNTALKAARGEWIKILHDDDVLKPHCLEVLAKIVQQRRNAVAVSCAWESFLDGKLVEPFDRRDRAVLEQIDSGDALLAMYILDEAGWAAPTQQMVHRSVVDAGVLFEQAPGITTLYDSWFNARVCARGPTLIYNVPLVEWHQGRHETTTSRITDDQLTAEFLAFRKLVLPLIPKDRKPPSLKSAEGMIMIIHALSHLRKMRPWAAIQIAARINDACAYRLAIDWLLRRYYPRRFSSVVRTVIWREEGDVEGIANGSTCLADRSFASYR